VKRSMALCARTGSAKSVRNAFIKACHKAGIRDFHFHDLRHTAASHMAMAGVDAFLGRRNFLKYVSPLRRLIRRKGTWIGDGSFFFFPPRKPSGARKLPLRRENLIIKNGIPSEIRLNWLSGSCSRDGAILLMGRP
jgi:hypothetical protein